ncbi:PhzF family phenazine biosynthesis protein [Ferruginivarius sediminum]|uniref:PhzF family phenazine biosynthesis protein n=1 Tax=Ferruginivarius sediminum TaxID=2661937 RepID=A0A369TAF9_9PROT|nr:PhzF family phenazine biosynthesis protein [Ferruginivarius sediminum]RDD61484.1 PhzF family phenazine biosynthesis protein [Ferruginivarius sediminum]
MTIRFFQVDAFAERLFSGNPAGVCPLDEWLPDQTMQAIAAENNLAETAFFVPSRDADADYDLRWFTPTVEMDLCGHATLATAYVLAEQFGDDKPVIRFSSMSGPLAVAREGERFVLDFPAAPPRRVAEPQSYADALGAAPADVWRGGDFALAVYADQTAVADLRPDLEKVAALPDGAVVATAEGEAHDFVSRCFVPKAGIPEDPVTGSAHCALIPYWAARLGKAEMTARQISARGGELHCRLDENRVKIGGRCALYLEGRLLI